MYCPECEMVQQKDVAVCLEYFLPQKLDFKLRPVKPPQSLRRDCRSAGTSVQCPSEEIKIRKMSLLPFAAVTDTSVLPDIYKSN